MKKASLFFLALILFSGCTIKQENEKLFEEAWVKKVIDGDTIELAGGQKVRLIGINAPEKSMPCYNKAKNFLEKKVYGKKVLIEFDKEKTDRYGRWLAFIYADKKNINLELVKQGLSIAFFVGNNRKHETKILNAEKNAKNKGIGCIWQKSPTTCLAISNYKLSSEEFVEIKNVCSKKIELKNYLLHDTANNSYTFPDINLEPKKTIKIYSGQPGKQGFKSKHVWNDTGDQIFIRNGEGLLELTQKLTPN